MPMVDGSPLDLAPYVFVSECLHVSNGGTSFYLLFSKRVAADTSVDLKI